MINYPTAPDQLCHGPAVVGSVNCDDLQQQIVPDVAETEELKENSEDVLKKTYLHGVNYLLWFEGGIEDKDPMDEEDWGGKVEFGFSDKHFEKNSEDYFILLEEKSTILHNCAGRVSGLQAHARDKVLDPPDYDQRDIVKLIEKYSDALLSDTT